MLQLRRAALATIGCLVSTALPAAAENLTPKMSAILAEEKLDPAIMAGLDQELAVPQALLDAAKKEGAVQIRLQMSEQEFAGMNETFSARYPGIQISYTRGIGRERAIGPLIAFQAGNYVTDVVAAYDTNYEDYRAANALEKISDLPAYAHLWPEMKTKAGTDGADKMNYWCLSYSTQRVQPADIPKSWDDLVTNPRWKNGKVGMYNASVSWLPQLREANGEKWMVDFLTKLVNDMHAQYRKETLAATDKLISVGEFDIFAAVQDYVVDRDKRNGVPVAADCPSPIPASAGYIGIFRGSPHVNAAKLFINWYLSKEGQVAAFHYARQVPVNIELKRKEFLPFPEEIEGKKIVLRTESILAQADHVGEIWEKIWESAGNKAR
jgi:iron(III) transport system substrate-binding protein